LVIIAYACTASHTAAWLSSCCRAPKVETHYPNDSAVYLALRNVDLACCAAFALEWAFWLWLAQRRLRYVASLQSLVDLVTIVPTAVSSLVNTRVSSCRERWGSMQRPLGHGKGSTWAPMAAAGCLQLHR
jgi:hypothetical protein